MFNYCCGCCYALRSRYKRLVDNIFPVYPQDGLIKSNMEKLIYYSLNSPEKLDRIGEYLFQKASRDLYRHRYDFVMIAMEAMDQLLLACHAQTLNLFVESFLKMVQKLLETTDPQLQILATQSFVRFANIEEDTPSYHRRYDFFVSKFSSMCHSNAQDKVARNSIRLAGIHGLQAVVRKTVTDDLVENIWEQQYMDKIIPSLLFNMQNSCFRRRRTASNSSSCSNIASIATTNNDDDPTDPPMLAETCFRELIGRASFGHIRSVLKPVLKHFDDHNLWIPNKFAIHTFRIIMFSIQAQYSYTVVETLMAHLDENSKSSAMIRTTIADVLSKIISIGTEESIGPSVLEIINSLLRNLQSSVQQQYKGPQSEYNNEKLYQEALINALGEFADHLPDYQKIEIMIFIINKIPEILTPANTLLQSILLKSLLKVGTKYQTIHLNTTFPVSFLHPLLRMSLTPDPEMRLLVQRILHTLIDRHQNKEKLAKLVVNVNELDLNMEKSSRLDLIFINKYGSLIYDALYTNLQMDSNTVENMEAVYITLALLCVELANPETVIDLLQLILCIQSLALNANATLSNAQRFQLHAIVATLLILIANIVTIPSLVEYAQKMIDIRKTDAPHLLPELLVHYPPELESANKIPNILVDQMAVCECLKLNGLDATRLQHSTTLNTGIHPGNSWIDTDARGSIIEIINGPEDVDSVSSSPGMTRKTPEERLTFENIKGVLTNSNETRQCEEEAEAEKCQQLCNTFRTASFDELMRLTKPKHDILKNRLNEIFKSLEMNTCNTPFYDYFPELFIY